MDPVERDASASIGAGEYHRKTGITRDLRNMERSFREKMIDPATGLVKRECVESRPCPVCGSGEHETVFVKNGFDHVRCTCGMIHVSPVLRDEYLNLVYAGADYEAETHDSFRSEPRRSFIEALYAEGIELLRFGGKSAGSLLDVGCSSGLFMEYAASRGYQPWGIEPSEYAVRAWRAPTA